MKGALGQRIYVGIRLNYILKHLGRDKIAAIHRLIKCIFLNENLWISFKISLKFILKIRINNISALIQVMVCRHMP